MFQIFPSTQTEQNLGHFTFTPAGVLATTTDGVIDYHNTLPVKVGRTTYTYDQAGRITRTVTKRLSKKPLVHHFFYATGEQPIGFTSSDEPNTGYRYTYDGLGRRVAKDTINTTTGEVTHRDVFTHTGNQLAAVTTTVDTDPAHVGEGYVWTTDPATGQTHGQIALTNGTSGTTQTPANPAAGWSQARVDATFYALVCDLAGAPQELINTTTGVVEGHTTQTLYGKRTWAGRCTSPLLFAGQYEDAESGWAYNRFRYYNPTLGAYNAQDPLGLAPRLASAQGYVDHAAFWVDMLGLRGKEAHSLGMPKVPHDVYPNRFTDGTFKPAIPSSTDSLTQQMANDAVLRKAGLTAPPPLDPAPNGVVRSIGNTPSHQAALQARYEELTRTGATDIRINQQQVNMQGQHVGYNRPDLQFTQNGQRFTEEWDRVSSNRGELHRIRTEANDPTVTVILHQFD
ncbi:RHS repeat-associated core domain-containing protein [Corynebacterium sp. ACRQK]|uniref:RHS repeat-associated core domain-containing protein n=1 Tax=Corynebacterium sp. ACRQK TaxID=2918190 RepID=UPI0027146FD3|nr:RHS repeat-associated core domain-containing protein [Corynebacterium sp. ACRQK]